MSVTSMTGFARNEGRDGAYAWSWEAKSVNAKGLDVRCRLPVGFEGLELAARERAAKHFRRGNLTLALNLNRVAGEGGYKVNETVLGEFLATLPEIMERVPDAGKPTVDGLLNLRGVIEPVEDALDDAARKALETNILAGLDDALARLAEMRADEGARLKPVLDEQLEHIGRLRTEAEGLAAAQPDAIRERLKTQIETLIQDVPAISEERLAQEAAILMSKADLREELDRLGAHCQAAAELLANGGAIGRKLDFLCQEFNREANTLCSKAQDVALTRVGLDMKAVIEQFREQVQNIE